MRARNGFVFLLQRSRLDVFMGSYKEEAQNLPQIVRYFFLNTITIKCYYFSLFCFVYRLALILLRIHFNFQRAKKEILRKRESPKFLTRVRYSLR